MANTVTKSEPGTLTGPNGDINVIITVTAVQQPGGFYNLDYKITGATPEDAAKLCTITDPQSFLNSQNSQSPDGVSNADYLADLFGGTVAIMEATDLKGSEVNEPTDNFAGTAVKAITDVLNGCRQALNEVGNFLYNLSDGVGTFTWLHGFDWPSLPNFHDPLILNFQGTSLNLTSEFGSAVSFDFSDSGTPTQTGWITAGEGFLILNNGSSNIASELLGAQSGNGFADLKALDSNGDGVINELR